MRLCMFSPKGRDLERGWPGIVEGDVVVQVAAQTIQSFFTGGGRARRHAEYPLAEGDLRPPVLHPPSVRDFYAFEQHVRTARAARGLDVPPEWYEQPVFYFSNPAAIYGPEDEIPYPEGTSELDYELEVAAVVGADGRIGGFTVMNDWSARDLQRAEMKLGLGPAKGKDFATSLGPPRPDVEPGRGDSALPSGRAHGVLLPERRGRRGDLRPRGQRHARDDLRRPALQRRRLRRRAARDDLPLPARRGAALPRLRDAGPDHDPASLPQRPRPADGARAVLPPRHPPAGRAPHPPRARRVRRQGARPRRLPDLRARLPPLRRRRLGRLRLPVDVLDPRLRADHGADPHAAAEPPDLPGPELRDLLVLSAQARLRPERDPDPLPPLEPAVGGDDLLRLRQLRLAARDRRRLDHAPPVGPAARAAAGACGEVDRHDGDDGARRHVRHVPAAQAHEARRRARRRALRLLLVRDDRAGARGEGRRRGSGRRDVALLSFTPRQAEILDAAHAWAAVDPRVRALVLKGSFGRGEGDERSDLDLVIVAEPGRRDELWAERRAVAERLGRLLGLFRDVANWRPPNLAIATFDGPLKVDLFFEDGDVEPSRWLRDGFEVLLDKDEVGERLRARPEALAPQALDDLHEDLAELDSHAWDFALWLDRKLELGDLWLVRL